MYCLNLLAIAMELASEDPCYEDVASKFWEHFLYIAKAINNLGSDGGMWNEEDGFFYDVLHMPGRACADEDPVDGGADSAVRGGNAGAGDGGQAAGIQAAHGVVHRAPAGPGGKCPVHEYPGRRAAAAALDCEWRAAAPRAESHAG